MCFPPTHSHRLLPNWRIGAQHSALSTQWQKAHFEYKPSQLMYLLASILELLQSHHDVIRGHVSLGQGHLDRQNDGIDAYKP